MWNIDTGECKYVLHGHTSTVRCIAMHGDIGEFINIYSYELMLICTCTDYLVL